MVDQACLPSNAYYLRTPDYTLYSGVHVCWSEHSESSFIYGFMSLDYGLGTMTTTTWLFYVCCYRYFIIYGPPMTILEGKASVRPFKVMFY